jgi:hypothetical protein
MVLVARIRANPDQIVPEATFSPKLKVRHFSAAFKEKAAEKGLTMSFGEKMVLAEIG